MKGRLKMKVLILYFTKTGHTLEAVNATAEGIRSAGSDVEIVKAEDFTPDMLLRCDALIVGSPCWKGSILKKAGIADPIKKALEKLEPGSLKGKRCGGISVHSGAGAENTVRNMGYLIKDKGCDDYRYGPVAAAGVPLSLWRGPSVKPEAQEQFKAFGAEFVS